MTTFTLPVQGGATRALATGDAATMSATPQSNGLLETKPGEWAVTHSPVANTQAIASKAAGGAGVRHVCKSVSARLIGGTTAPAAVSVTLNLRDGASGAGSVLMSWTFVLAGAIAAKDNLDITDLNIIGSANTAMTLEFSAAGGANTFESVNISGFSVN